MQSPYFRIGIKVVKVILLIVIFTFLVTGAMADEFKVKTVVLDIRQNVGVSVDAEKEWEDINKDIFAAKATYTGDLTGYSADCPLCYGTLACKPSYKVYKNNVVTYNDKVYGNVRIVASSKKLACGSVIRFNSNRVSNEETYAIVLDRGVLGRDIDLLVPNQSYAINNIGRSKIEYDVVRFGW